MSTSECADWSLLPPHFLIAIAEKLLITDIIRLRAVCAGWAWSLGRPRSGWPTPPQCQASFVPIPPSIPWMLLNENGEDADFCSFLDLSDGQVRRISPVPEMVGRRCVGASPDGWLVTLDLKLTPRVLNPLTREELPLPSLLSLFYHPFNVSTIRDDSSSSSTGFIGRRVHNKKVEFRDKHILKIVLTSAPPSGIAAVIYGSDRLRSHLALARVGDASWTPVTSTINPSLNLQYVADVYYNKNNHKIYVMTLSGSVHFFDLHINNWLHGGQMSLAPLSMKSTRLPVCVKASLSEFQGLNRHVFIRSGHLLQISRKIEEYNEMEVQTQREGLPLYMAYVNDEIDDFELHNVKAETTGVQIMKFDLKLTQQDHFYFWIPANESDLDDQAIFVGCNNAFSLSTTGRPGLRKNSIYFTETSRNYGLEWRQHVRDAGVFDVEAGAFQRFFTLDSEVNWPPPVWFMPCQLRFEYLS